MKRLLLFLLLLFPVASFSQPHISYSESFPVPEKGDNKLLNIRLVKEDEKWVIQNHIIF